MLAAAGADANVPLQKYLLAAAQKQLKPDGALDVLGALVELCAIPGSPSSEFHSDAEYLGNYFRLIGGQREMPVPESTCKKAFFIFVHALNGGNPSTRTAALAILADVAEQKDFVAPTLNNQEKNEVRSAVEAAVKGSGAAAPNAEPSDRAEIAESAGIILKWLSGGG